MLIIADENIPGVHEAFSSFGEIKTLHGRHMTAVDVRDAEVLLVRSITKVNAELLADSQVRFVGSATIGTDHVDLPWLRQQGIAFANAPGCNAVSAAEYVIASVLQVASRNNIELAGKTVGIVGCGNVGSRVKARFEAMGLSCLICDPPRAEKEGVAGFVDMQAIAQADIVTVHVPLVLGGNHPTRGLITARFIRQLSPDVIFINTSRGDVTDEVALKWRLQEQSDMHAILDVWENEPNIDAELVSLAAIATPHIAGYSIDGKLRATGQLYEAYCQLMGQTPAWDYAQTLPVPPNPVIKLQNAGDVIAAISEALSAVYDVMHDDVSLRQLFETEASDVGHGFDQLRKQYPVRRECSAYQIISDGLPSQVQKMLQSFDFQLN